MPSLVVKVTVFNVNCFFCINNKACIYLNYGHCISHKCQDEVNKAFSLGDGVLSLEIVFKHLLFPINEV